MKDCIFCKIVAGEVPSEKILENEDLIVFKDIHPSAPTHLLIVPKKHIKDLSEASDNLWIKIKEAAGELKEKLDLSGYRLATNVGGAADIAHMHVHFLAGIKKDRKL